MFFYVNNLVKHIILCGFIVYSIHTSAQLLPTSNYYVYNAISINPAICGTDNALSVNFFSRNQWTGVTGAPKTSTLSIHSPITKHKTGLGLEINRDSYGIFMQTKLSIQYSYALKLHKGSLSLGFNVKGVSLEEFWGDIIATDIADEGLYGGNPQTYYPNFGMGIFYKGNKTYWGISIPEVFHSNWYPELNENHIVYSSDQVNYFAFYGRHINMNMNVDINPGIMLKYSSVGGIYANVTPLVTIKEMISFGASYGNTQIAAALIQFKANRQLLFGYTYDFETGKNIRKTGGSHEVMLKYVFSYNVNLESPR